MIEITADDAEAGLKALIEQEGADYVYEAWYKNEFGKRCTYVKDGKGDCGVGRYLADKGVPVERLAEFDDQKYALGAREVLDVLQDEGVLTYDKEAKALLANFQALQDSNVSWGKSLDDALWHRRS